MSRQSGAGLGRPSPVGSTGRGRQGVPGSAAPCRALVRDQPGRAGGGGGGGGHAAAVPAREVRNGSGPAGACIIHCVRRVATSGTPGCLSAGVVAVPPRRALRLGPRFRLGRVTRSATVRWSAACPRPAARSWAPGCQLDLQPPTARRVSSLDCNCTAIPVVCEPSVAS